MAKIEPRERKFDADGTDISEWFQTESMGPDPKPPPELGTPAEHGGMTPELSAFYGKLNKRKNTTFANGMSNKEVQVRLSDAAKVVRPENQKWLDETTSARKGLELNPLWMMETMLRGGVMNVKEMAAACNVLAQYTHSKAPTISHATKTEMTAEDWLMDLGDPDIKPIAPPVNQRANRAPDGTEKNHKWKKYASRSRIPNGSEGDFLVVEGESIDIDDDRRVVPRADGETEEGSSGT